jgi:hypothetical protein
VPLCYGRREACVEKVALGPVRPKGASKVPWASEGRAHDVMWQAHVTATLSLSLRRGLGERTLQQGAGTPTWSWRRH